DRVLGGRGAVPDPGKDRLTLHQPHVPVRRVAYLPQDVVALAEAGRHSDVQGKQPLSALSEGTHQEVLAWRLLSRGNHDRPVDEIAMSIIGPTEFGQIAPVDDPRDVGKEFITTRRVKSMQHAVVGADVHGPSRAVHAGHVSRRRSDDVAEQVIAITQGTTLAHFKRAVTSDVGGVLLSGNRRLQNWTRPCQALELSLRRL